MACGGSLVDRGPDSGGTIDFCIENNIRGVLGNHEHTFIKNLKKYNEKYTPKNPEKAKTYLQIVGNTTRIEYIKNLPMLHVCDDLNLVIVHAGLLNKPLYSQNEMVLRMQLIHDFYPNETHWFIQDPNGKSEEYWLQRGFHRWYNKYDYMYNVIYGHSRVNSPKIIGRTIGIDTGSAFGGKLTACIYPDMKFVQVDCREYVKGNVRYE